MIFGPTRLEEAKGAILAHTMRLTGRVLKKGTVLDDGAIAALRDAGHREIIAARLEVGDVPEDEAAERLGQVLAVPLLARSRAATGRVNILAETAGLLVLDTKRIARLTELGHTSEAMGRIHAPVGLNIEAITAPEIALSIMAEIVAARRGAALGAVRPIPGVAA